jgi:chromosome transmission fidelity protein 4
LLDTTQLDRVVLAKGRREERYWPVGVAGGRFHAIVLKGGDKHPYFPRPMIVDFAFRVPLGYIPTTPSDEDDEDAEPKLGETQSLEQSFILTSTLLTLLSPTALPSQRAQLTLQANKSLLQLLAAECREGDESRGMKGLEIVQLMMQQGGERASGNAKMVDAAVKVARRYGMGVLAGKILEVGERGFVEEDGEDE